MYQSILLPIAKQVRIQHPFFLKDRKNRMPVSGLYVLSVLTTMLIPVLTFIVNNSRIITPTTGNPTYTAANTLLLLYSIGASLLLYGMMLYLFTSLPAYAPLAVLLIDLVLIITTLGTLFANPWQVRNWKVKRNSEGVSGIDPSFLAISLSVISVLIILPLIILWYQNIDQRLGILLLFNLLLIPFFFLTSSTINSFALSGFISDLH